MTADTSNFKHKVTAKRCKTATKMHKMTSERHKRTTKRQIGYKHKITTKKCIKMTTSDFKETKLLQKHAK